MCLHLSYTVLHLCIITKSIVLKENCSIVKLINKESEQKNYAD